MKKKIIALCLVISLLAVAVVGSTMAYFTDTDETVNVMTMGRVKIEQHEQQRTFAADGTVSLVDFEQDKILKPSAAPAGYITYSNLPNDAYKFFADSTVVGAQNSLPNPIDKIVTVKNTGNINAYVRTIFAFEAPEGFDRNAHAKNPAEGGWAILRNDVTAETKGTMDNTEWSWTFFDDVRFTMTDGNEYVIAVATSTKPLEPGQTTIPNLLQYYLNGKTEADDVAALGATVEIYAVTQGVQADGFADAETAFAESFGKIEYKDGAFVNLPWDAWEIELPSATVATMSETATDDTFGDMLKSFNISAPAHDVVDLAMEFGIKDPEADIHDNFSDWHADFVLTFNKDIKSGGTLGQLTGNAEDSKYNDKVVLLGDYANAGTWPCPIIGDIEAGKEYRVMELFDAMLTTMDPSYAGIFYPLSYDFIQTLVKEFRCGIVFDLPGKISGSADTTLNGTMVTVELRMYETVKNESTGEWEETGKSYTIEELTYTYNAD